jgi:hypothetical protein
LDAANLMAEQAPIASFEFRRGPFAGSHLSLFRTVLVHRGAEGFESIPLDRVASLGVAFERDSRLLIRGWVLLVVAIVLLAAFWPLRAVVSSILSEVTAQGQPGGFLPAAIKLVHLSVALLPYLSVIVALLATASLAFGWLGETVLRVMIAPVERVFATRGRDAVFFEFAETVAARLEKRE